MITFKVGDVVTLKSGGPKMTISTFNTMSKTVACKWFSVDNKIASASFHNEMVKTV